MNYEEKENVIKQLKSMISAQIDLRRSLSDDEIRETITDVVFEYSKQEYLSVDEKREMTEWIFNSMRRLDVLQPLLDDPSVSEIMINGPSDIFIERDGKTVRHASRFESAEKLEDVIQTIVSKVNRNVNEAVPIVDARLLDGSRVNVVLKPVALRGPVMTIRKFSEQVISAERLVSYGSITKEVAEVLKSMVTARYNIFISGGTSSGKTTFLNALSNFIPSDERIITIEDSAELKICGIENYVSLETRNANTEGKGSISMRDLIKSSLRIRPERIIVGEVRGPEALDMLQAMNTGHDGSLSTGHANSPEDMLSRLETMVLMGTVMPLEAIRKQIASAIDVIIHLGRLRDRSRRVLEIAEVVGYKNGEIQLNPLFVFEETGEGKEGKVLGQLVRTKNEMYNRQKFKMHGVSDQV